MHTVIVTLKAQPGKGQVILDALAAPVVIGNQHLHVTASIGVAIGNGDELTPDELLNNADAAMYERRGIRRDGAA